MELTDFIRNFAAQFDDTDASEFSNFTVFKSLKEWSSLTALSIIAMVDEQYNVKIKGEDIRNNSTIEDLYNLVKKRL
jgi:acyl carrier protein